jgi:hypothetical protein
VQAGFTLALNALGSLTIADSVKEKGYVWFYYKSIVYWSAAESFGLVHFFGSVSIDSLFQSQICPQSGWLFLDRQ